LFTSKIAIIVTDDRNRWFQSGSCLLPSADVAWLLEAIG